MSGILTGPRARVNVMPWEPVLVGRDPVVNGAIVTVGYSASAPRSILQRVPAIERHCLDRVGPARRCSFIAGRIALRAALTWVGKSSDGIGISRLGAPQVPKGFVGSVSHSTGVAVAIAARDFGYRVGIDIERLDRWRPYLMARTLGEAEHLDCWSMPVGLRVPETAIRFSIKEAAFKAASSLTSAALAYEDLEVTGVYSNTEGFRRAALEHSGTFAGLAMVGAVTVEGQFVIAVCGAKQNEGRRHSRAAWRAANLAHYFSGASEAHVR